MTGLLIFQITIITLAGIAALSLVSMLVGSMLPKHVGTPALFHIFDTLAPITCLTAAGLLIPAAFVGAILGYLPNN